MVKRFKPTTPSRRHLTVRNPGQFDAERPLKALTASMRKTGGRNNQGIITIRHRGGGNKRRYRIIDFHQIDKRDILGKVEAIEYDPNRTAFIARVLYVDGERRYILAPEGLRKGDKVKTFSGAGDAEVGYRMQLKYIPTGTAVHNIALKQNGGGKIIRSAGSAAQVMAKEGNYVTLLLPSKETRLVIADAFASIGQVSNADHMNITIGKAGRNRWKGVRPTVRGTAMNPVDHPHGGGEGRQPIGLKHPKTPWGKPALGVKTRKPKKYSRRLIVSRRKKK